MDARNRIAKMRTYRGQITGLVGKKKGGGQGRDGSGCRGQKSGKEEGYVTTEPRISKKIRDAMKRITFPREVVNKRALSSGLVKGEGGCDE